MRFIQSLQFESRLAASIFCCLLFTSDINAQPSWAKSAWLNDISALSHTDAELVVLYRCEETRIGGDGHAASHVQIAYKILKSTGINAAAFVEGAYAWRKVKAVHGWHVLPTGKKETLDPASLVSVDPLAAADAHDDSHMLVGGFEKAVVGSMVAFEYDVEENHDWAGTFQSFSFQRQHPVAWAQYTVKLPAGWRLTYALKNGDAIAIDSAADRYTWTVHNLQYRPDEPLMPQWSELERAVFVNCYPANTNTKVTNFPNWHTAAAWVDSLHYLPAEPNKEVTQFVDERFAPDATFDTKLRSIASFVQNDIRYVAIEIGKGRFVPHHSSSTLRNRYGDCKDKVALMRAMLTSFGMPSKSALARVHTDIQASLSTPFQFDHCILAIPSSVFPDRSKYSDVLVGDWVLFDPTEPSAPLGTLPMHLYGSFVLIADDTDSCLMQIPMLQSDRSYRRYAANADLAPDGSFSADVRIVDHGNMAAYTSFRRRTMPLAERIDSVRQRFTNTIPEVQITNYQSGEDGDSVWATYTLSGKNYLQTSGDLRILKLDFMIPSEQPAFKRTERTHPIWLGYPWCVQGEITWHLPDGWSAEVLDSIGAQCRTAHAGLTMSTIDEGLKCTYQHTSVGELMEASEYTAARSFRRDYERITSAKTILRTE